MDTVHKIIIGAVSTIAFCVGLYLLITEVRIVSNMYDVVRKQMKDDEIYEQYYVEDIEEVSYAELVAVLLNDLEFDIAIDGFLIRKDEHDINKISSYNLRTGNYKKEYQYDEKGNIILIAYTYKG